jgi:PKD repeat protein
LQNPSYTYAAAGTYVVCLTTSNACTSATTCDTLTVIAVGLENSLVDAMKAWPNPAQQQLNVTFPANVEGIELSLFDLAGKELRHSQLAVGQTFAQIDLRNLANGSYFLQASTASAQKTLKIQVMH